MRLTSTGCGEWGTYAVTGPAPATSAGPGPDGRLLRGCRSPCPPRRPGGRELVLRQRPRSRPPRRSRDAVSEVEVDEAGHGRRSPRPWPCSRRCRGPARAGSAVGDRLGGRARRTPSPASAATAISLTCVTGLLGEGEADPARLGPRPSMPAMMALSSACESSRSGCVSTWSSVMSPASSPRLGDVAEGDLDEAVVGARLLAGAGDGRARRRGTRWLEPSSVASAWRRSSRRSPRPPGR